jgi:hypothetical protein
MSMRIRLHRTHRLLTLAALIVPAIWVAAASPQNQTTVPFVGCAADGQTGPRLGPAGHPVRVDLSPAISSRLAYYGGRYAPGVLAPRGWQCFVTYGSNGASLFVAPHLPPHNTFFAEKFPGLTGPAIQISNMDGGTSGRFSVAETVARVFPAHRQFAQKVLDEHSILTALPSGPYPTDMLTRRNDNFVEYLTPPNTDGLGTDTRLVKGDLPISGVEIYQPEEPNVISVAVRLAPGQQELIAPIISDVERRHPPNEKR